LTIALLTNDDGIDSIGLRRLVKEVAARGLEVYVVAPKYQVSGAGKSNSRVVRVERVEVEGAREAWAIDGRPADAVAIAVKALLPRKPDVVVSGINIGPNMGLTDFFTSGTIGAAIEAALLGIRAVASSYAVLRGLSDSDEPYVRKAAMVTAEVTERFLEDERLKDVDILVLNFPRGEPKGLVVAPMAFMANIEVYNGEEENVYHVLGWKTDDLEEAYAGGDEGTDVYYVKRGYATVTPVCLRCLALTTAERRLIDIVKRALNGLVE